LFVSFGIRASLILAFGCQTCGQNLVALGNITVGIWSLKFSSFLELWVFDQNLALGHLTLEKKKKLLRCKKTGRSIRNRKLKKDNLSKSQIRITVKIVKIILLQNEENQK
jgi:hypothetical protein